MPELATTESVQFEARRGPYIMIPYCPQNGTEQHEALINLYFRLKSEGLDKVVFHENPGITLLEFMNFFSSPKCLLQVMALMSGNDMMDICGMAWLADITECGGALRKATGSFLFFKDYQKRAYTGPLSEIIFDYWFNVLNIDTLVGLTPALNRAASIFVKSMGMNEICRIPQYTTFEGIVCDGIVSHLTKQAYLAGQGVDSSKPTLH